MRELPAVEAIEELKVKLAKIEDREKKARITRFVVSALSNVPWVGGLIGAGSAFHAEREQGRINDLQRLWMEEHQRKIGELASTIFKIIDKIEAAQQEFSERWYTDEYLGLIRKGFSVWNEVETHEKRECVRRLLTNASLSRLSSDDMVRLFLDWINTYHETHFLVIREIYTHKHITRAGIWKNISNSQPEENSIEADLYKLLIRDLSTGGIIRQVKQDSNKKTIRQEKGKYKSAFDGIEPYELTALGHRFVLYTMEEISSLQIDPD